MNSSASFGYWVRRQRKALDLTQNALARLVGCATVTIKKIEADERRPSRQIAECLAEALAIPAAERPLFLQCARGERSVERLGPPAQVQRDALPLDDTPAARSSRSAPSSDQTNPALLLATKLYIPPPRPNLVARPRLLARLDAGQQHPLTLILAPVGFGKTTLLSDWIHHRPAETRWPVAWLSLDEHDNDPLRFWSYVIAALERGHGPLHVSLAEIGTAPLGSPQSEQLLSAITAMSNALAGAPGDLTLVIDDYHLIEAPAIHDSLAFLLAHLPPRLHLVIASRTDPPFSLARLRAQGALTELRTADLRFTPTEAASFLREVMGLHLAPEELAALEARTEGWIAGLHLAALSMQGREDIPGFLAAFSGSHRYVLDYLADEVLRRQPEDVQRFLLRTSILDRLNDSLCDAVTGCQGSRSMLARLEQANLFLVPLDDQRRWYRYHRLFADVLRERLQQTEPEQLTELHRRAGAWYARREMAAEAIDHLLAGGDFAGAARLVERAGVTAFQRSEMMALRRWLEALPEEYIRAQPRIGIFDALVVIGEAKFDVGEARLKDAERELVRELNDVAPLAAEAPAGQARALPAVNRRAEIESMLGEVAALRSFSASLRDDAAATIAWAREALERLPEDNLHVRGLSAMELGFGYLDTGDLNAASEAFSLAARIGRTAGSVFSVLAATGGLATVRTLQGHLHEAARLCEQALPLATDKAGQRLPAAVYAHVALGELLYEWNDLERAEFILVEGIHLGRQTGLVVLLANSYHALSRVKQARGDFTGALDTARTAHTLVQQHNIGSLVRKALVYEVRLSLARGDVAAAVRWAQARGLSIHDELSLRHELEHITLAQLLIAQHNPDEALHLLRRLQAAAEAGGRGSRVIVIHVLQALAHHARGNTRQALAILAQALSRAAPEGYVRTFVDRGEPVASLLSMLEEAQFAGWPGEWPVVPREYIRTLLAALKLFPLQR